MRLPLTMSVLSASLLLTGSAVAAPFAPRITQPTSYKDILYGLQEMRENIAEVQCGGTAPASGASVSGTSVSGTIPVPTFTAINADGSEDSVALPGRNNVQPLGQPATGLGVRGDFEYPESAWGYSSSCDVYQQSYIDEDLKLLGKQLVIHEDGTVEVKDGNVPVAEGEEPIDKSGNVDINPHRWCLREGDKATPQFCKRLYDAWREASAIIPRENVKNTCPCEGTLNGCPLLVEKHYCFDDQYTFECAGTSERKTPVVTTYPDLAAQETTCRTTWGPGFENLMTRCHQEAVVDDEGNEGIITIVDVEGKHRALSSSYYRHYAQGYMIPGITVTAPESTWVVRAECYEYYKEFNAEGGDFDPKEDVTGSEDEQCEFVIDESRSPEWPAGAGRSQKGAVSADPPITDPTRDPRSITEPWKADTETNLTMIDTKLLRDSSDITAMFGTLLPTRQTASKTVPAHARTDQFDDTAERTISAFLEEQQRELLKMTADPETRLIMPARFLVGLADDDLLFQYVRTAVSRSDGTVEITLKAGLEDLGSVLTSFQRVFVAPIREVRLPILVPLASVTEIDALIADWKLWKRATQLESIELSSIAEKETDAAKKTALLAQVAALDDAALGADPLILKLTRYREQTKKVRLLRGALAVYLLKLQDSQKEIREYFAAWYDQNSDLLLTSAKRAVQRRELKSLWRQLQNSMLEIDACQMLWCSNQRYSAPVYSLLDGWWGESQPGQKRDPDYRPQSLADLGYVQPSDQVFDFSNVKFPRDPWLIPVLWPVQARVRLPSPPRIGMAPPSADSFPELPSLPDHNVFESFSVPEVDLPEKSFIIPPESPDLEPAKQMLRDTLQIIDNGKSQEPSDRASMRSAYCRFPASILIPPDENRSDPARIVHVENDLRDRLARLFSRWMSEQTEDMAGRVVRLQAETTPACHEGVICYFLPSQKRTVTTWQWFMPDRIGGNFTATANDLKTRTLPATEEANPYLNASRDTLRRIFPALAVPITIELDIPRSTP